MTKANGSAYPSIPKEVRAKIRKRAKESVQNVPKKEENRVYPKQQVYTTY